LQALSEKDAARHARETSVYVGGGGVCWLCLLVVFVGGGGGRGGGCGGTLNTIRACVLCVSVMCWFSCVSVLWFCQMLLPLRIRSKYDQHDQYDQYDQYSLLFDVV